jgi:hypothetical protein
MSKLATGILGVFAVSLGFGVVQLAAGRDLMGKQGPAGTSEAVNRTAKADRADRAAGSAAASRTISLRFDALSDTSVLIRVPVAKETAKEARTGSPAPSLLKTPDRKATVACEPPVSVLTEVAKQLQPGRCVT